MTLEHEIVVEADIELETLDSKGLLVRAALAALAVGEVPLPVEVVVSVVDESEIQRLNREYRQIDAPTDVLSFAQRESAQFPAIPNQIEPIGDVVIAYQVAARQASAASHALDRELALLTIHGVLHLLGFDHAEPEEERVMFGLQDQALRSLMI